MNKLNPQELRNFKSSENKPKDIALNKDTEERFNEIDDEGDLDFVIVKTFLKKAFKHKKIIFLTFFILYLMSIYLYTNFGTWFEKKITVAFNSSTNNSFFKIIDQTLGVDILRSKEDLEAYASRAINNLNSDNFVSFCYEASSNDLRIAKIFGLDLGKKNTSIEKEKKKIRETFKKKFIISPIEKSTANLRGQRGAFQVVMSDFDQAFILDNQEKISEIIKNYLVKIDNADTEAASELLKNKTESLEKKIASDTEKLSKISQSIPLVDKSSIYSLQGQLQATRVAISGNKVLELQFKEKLADLENKIGTIGDLKSGDNEYALNQELSSLSEQKKQLTSQGVERGSFQYQNIAENLAKALKALENNQNTSTGIVQKNEQSSFYSLKAAELNRALDAINSYLDKKTEKNDSVSESINSVTVNFPENTEAKSVIGKPVPLLDEESFRELKSQLDSVKGVVEGNKYFKDRFDEKVSVIEKKLNLLNANKTKLEKSFYSSTIQDISNMAYLQKQLKLQGVDDDSFVAKKLTENLKKASDELEKNKNISLKNLRVDDFYMPDESSLYLQRESLEKVKSENSFYEAKILELTKSLDELTFLLNERMLKETQLADLEASIKKDRASLDLLNNSRWNTDLNIARASKRLEFSFEPIEEKTILPTLMFVFMSIITSFFIGLLLAYLVEVNNPYLGTISSFEELGNFVLGGVPSCKTNFFQQNNQVDGLSDLSYMRLGIRLENMFSSLNDKVILFSSNEDSLKSAIISLNLGAFFGSTGKKVLIIESDVIHNSIAAITGAPLNGGVSELYLHKEKIELYPYRVNEGLDVIAGDPLQVPSVYRLASQNFKELLSDLSLQYDYIFLHARPCLEAPDASDLSRYAGVGIVCCDAESMNIQKLEKLNQEMKAFLSKKTCFILENAKDIQVGAQSKQSQVEERKVAA